MSIVSATTQQPLAFPKCIAGSVTLPDIPGINVNLVEANVVRGAEESLVPGQYLGHGGIEFSGFDYCNISITYTHPRYVDEPIHIHVYLPDERQWNRRMMAVGGGGFVGGLGGFSSQSMVAGAYEGYMTLGTDAGHGYIDPDPKYWALDEEGNVNQHLLETFAYIAYDDLSRVGVELAKVYYGRTPARKYRNGCSTGGRQGMSAAQRYPEAYDGIVTTAPAINWASLLGPLMYCQMLMDESTEYPSLCELDALTSAAIQACDLDDGIADGFLANPLACRFDPYSLIGETASCSTGTVTISKIGAWIADGIWYGSKTRSGDKLWYGFAPDVRMEAQAYPGMPFQPALQWLRYFLAKDADFDHTKMTHEDFEQFFRLSVSEYEDIMSTNNPDLSAFSDRGGKMITVHGIADELIPYLSAREYYDRVLLRDPRAGDYYRHFESPGMYYCYGGPGLYVHNMFEDLVNWVENGVAPDVLLATSVSLQNETAQRPLCR